MDMLRLFRHKITCLFHPDSNRWYWDLTSSAGMRTNAHTGRGLIGSVADAACPKCSGEMYQRDDDNEATVRNRLDVYETSTSPLIDYYRGCELLVTIDGDRDPNVVYADVKEALDL